MSSSVSGTAGSLSARPIEAVRKISRSLKLIGARMVLRMVSAKGGDLGGSLLGHQDQAELVAGEAGQRVLRLEDAGEAARQRQQDRVADGDADGIVDLFEAIEVDHHDGRPQRRHSPGEIRDGIEAVDEQLAVRQAGQVVVHRVVQHALFGVLALGDVVSVPTTRMTSPSEPTTGRALSANHMK
jgi:hypothetical protein